MNVRAAEESDIASMMAIERDSETAAHWTEQNYNAIITDISPRRLALVLEENGRVQAFLVARSFAPDSGTEWELENVAVVPEARRRGLGAQLLGEFLNSVQNEGGSCVVLEVRESNGGARRLYEKWGFKPVGRRKSYYSGPHEDAILYRFEFPPATPEIR